MDMLSASLLPLKFFWRWGLSSVVANHKGSIGTVAPIKAISYHVELAILEHNLLFRSNDEGTIIELVSDTSITLLCYNWHTMLPKGKRMIRLKVKEIAESRGFNMSSLSRASDVSFLIVKRIWKEPFRGVNTTTLERLAKALDVSVSELFEEVPDE